MKKFFSPIIANSTLAFRFENGYIQPISEHDRCFLPM